MANFVKVILLYMPSYLGALSFGFMIGYTSPSLPKMQQVDEPFYDDQSSASWFGSIATIGGMIGCFLAGYLVDKVGRRKTLIFTSVPFLCGWLSILLGHRLAILNFGRFLTGIGGGMVCVVSPLYVSETSLKEKRGKFGAAVQLFITIGIVLVYLFGMFLTWKALAGLCAAFSVVSFLTSLYVPESPRHLFNIGQRKDALRVLTSLRDSSYDAEDEFRDMEDGAEENKLSLLEFLNPDLYKPLLVAVIVMIFQQLTGINAVMFYTVSIFISAGLKPDRGALATFIVGLVQVVATLIAAASMDRAGRRRLLQIAGVGMCISCFIMSFCFHFHPPVSDGKNLIPAATEIPSHNSTLGYMVLFSLVIYIASFALGWGPIPMLLASEIFPCRARGPAIGIATFFNWFFAFIVTLYFEDLQSHIGMDGVFLFFGVSCLLAIVYVFFSVPETMGRSLEDISFFFNVRLVRSI